MSISRIVVFPNNRDFFGAKLVLLPFLYEVKKHFKSARITVLTPFQKNGIFVGPGLADEALTYEKSGWRLSRTLKQLEPDLIFNLRPESGTVMRSLLFYRGGKRVSFHTRTASLLSDFTVPNNTNTYRALNFLDLCRPIFTPGNTEDFFKDYWNFTPIPKTNSKRVMMIVGAGTGEWKRWGIANFLQLAEMTIQNVPGCTIDFVCGNEEKQYLPDIKSFIATRADGSSRLHLHENPDPREIVKLLSETQLVVGNDAGPTHLAQLCRVPFVSINSGDTAVAKTHIPEWNRLDEITKVVMGEPGRDIKEIPPLRVFNEMRPLL